MLPLHQSPRTSRYKAFGASPAFLGYLVGYADGGSAARFSLLARRWVPHVRPRRADLLARQAGESLPLAGTLTARAKNPGLWEPR